MIKLITRVVAALFLAGSSAAYADITDQPFGANQVFDVQYSWSNSTTGAVDYGCYSNPSSCDTLNVSGLTTPYSSVTNNQPALTAGQYYKFFNSTTVPGTYGLAVYNADGTQAFIMHNSGNFYKATSSGMFYEGGGMYGTVFSPSTGYAAGSSASLSVGLGTPSSSDLSSYTASSTTVLTAGQTAGSTPPAVTPSPTAVTSSIITTVTPTSNNSPAGEGANKAVDGSSGSKYLNFDRASAGFTITLNQGKVIDGVKFTTANDFVPRDPTKFTLYGSNDGVTWTEITANQSTTLENVSGRYTQTSLVTIANTNAYVYYFITFPSIKAIDQYGSVAGCQAALGNLACDSVQIGEVTYYYDSNNTTTSVASGSGTIANPGTPGSTSSMTTTPTVVSTAPGTDIVSTATSNGTTTSSSTETRGATTSVSVVTDTRDRQEKVLNINRNITVTSTTPVTTTVVQTTPVTTTTTTTPTTVTTYSDGTTTTTNGTPVVTTSIANNVVTTSTTVNDVQVTSTDNTYSTRIDQFDRLAEANVRENALLVSDPLARHRVYDSEIKLVGANVNERTAFDMSASGSGTNTVDGYSSTANRYSLGIAHLVKTDLMIGARFSQVNLNMSGNDSTGSLYKNAINLYALWTRNDWLVKGDVGYAKNKFNTAHSLPELNLSNSASAAGDDLWAQIRLYTPAKKGVRLFAGARKEQNRRDYAIDSGSALSAVDYTAVNKTTDTTEAGLRFDHYVNDKMSVYAEYSQNNRQLETGKAGLSYLSGKNTSIQLGTIQQRQNNLQNSGAILELKVLF
jgi:hypothetical protein